MRRILVALTASSLAGVAAGSAAATPVAVDPSPPPQLSPPPNTIPPPPATAVNYAKGGQDWILGRNGAYDVLKSQCNGTNQSPLNIVDVAHGHHGEEFTGPGSEFNAHYDETLAPINVHYTAQTSWSVVVNDHTIEISLQDATTKSDGLTLPTGQFLQLKQFHMHAPSEHTINGASWPLEVHFVHNTNGTLGVIGMFFAIGEEENDVIASILSHLPKSDAIDEERTATGYLDASVAVTETLDISGSWFSRLDMGVYYSYQGSLTTPPCTEGLFWHVLPHPLTITQEQLTEITVILSEAQGGIGRGSNYRPTQPQNGRLVKKSFEQHETLPDCEAIDFAEHVRPLQLGSIILAIALAVLLLVNVVGASVWYYERKHAIMDMRRRSSVAPAPLGAGEHGAAGVGSKGAVGGPNAARKV